MKIKDMNINPLSTRWKERYSTQTPDIQKKLGELDKMNPREYQLRVIKKLKKEPMDGDVFVLSPRDNVYFYGKVLKANIQHISKDVFIHGKNLVFIFKTKSREIDMVNYRSDYSNLLIDPAIVDSSYWSKGYFYTIGNEEVKDFEKNLDYGFYKLVQDKFYKENGVEMERQPLLFGTYGIATISGIASRVEKELIFDPTLLEF